MSLANEYFFLDNSGIGSDPNAKAGNDINDGLTDNNAKQSYTHALEIANSAEAGTVINLGYSCGFIQPKNFRINNSKAVTTIVNLTFDGSHCICEMLRPCNITVGQKTIIKGVKELQYSGIVTCTEVIDALTFKYSPNAMAIGPPPPTATRLTRSDKMRCSAGAIIFKPYLSAQFQAVRKTRPVCEYKDSSNSQHRFDQGVIQGIEFHNIDYFYTGLRQGSPNCFFIYQTDKESITLDNLNIDGYRIGIYPNNKIGLILDLTISKCRITNNWFQGYMGNADYSLIEKNYFDNNGYGLTGGSNRLHNIYLSNCNFTTVRNNELTKSAMKSGKAMGTELVIHGECSNLIIEDNWIHNEIGASDGGNYGIGVNSGYNSPESFTNILIQRNKIENCGNKSISCNAWIGGFVKENIIISDQTAYKHTGIMFDKERSNPDTPTSDGVSIINNQILGKAIFKDIDIQAGTNFTIVRPGDNPTVPPKKDLIEVLTTTQIKVNGTITAKNATITLG